MSIALKRTPTMPITAKWAKTCGNSSVGRAQPCQGWGREFESRFPLQTNPLMTSSLDPLPKVNVRHHIHRLISVLLLAPPLFLASPAVAHEMSDSTCAADVVFLWDQKHFANCVLHGGVVNPKAEGQYCGGAASMVHRPGSAAADQHGRVRVGARRPILYGHSKAVIEALSATGADVRFGTEFPRRDLEQNTIVTYNILEAMRNHGIRKIAFASTGSVYGEATIIPTPEGAPFPIQTSLYAASKLAGEGMIAAYCEGFGFQSWIFRFVSILGERYTHGHVFDFYRELKQNPSRLEVLGNGKQRKSYLYIQDCIDAILLALEKSNESVNVLNLGVDGYCEVNDSIGWICEELGVSPKFEET